MPKDGATNTCTIKKQINTRKFIADYPNIGQHKEEMAKISILQPV